MSLYKKTPHPSRFARHLLPLEKAGKNPCFRQRVYWIHARRTFICGRADNACTNLLGFLV